MQQKTTSKIRLRDVTHDDLPRIYEMQLDLESNRIAVTIPRSEVAFDALWLNVLRDPNITAKVILADEVLVGHISCFKMDGLDSVGYWIDKEFWGKGIATQALELLLIEVTARPLYAQVATSNGASLRVLKKCGFMVQQVHIRSCWNPPTGQGSPQSNALLLKQTWRNGLFIAFPIAFYVLSCREKDEFRRELTYN